MAHIERCQVLLHLVDGTQDKVAEAYQVVRAELIAYGHGLAEKPEVVAVSKVDALENAVIARKQSELEAVASCPVITLSSASGRGIIETLGALEKNLETDESTHARPSEDWTP